VIAARTPQAEAIRATYGGAPGHPVLLERRLLGRIHVLHGDTGARAFLKRARVVEVACDGLGSAADIDTPGGPRGAEVKLEQSWGADVRARPVLDRATHA
jgi:CTP:molybdopterin cytidylyltransferase MocA